MWIRRRRKQVDLSDNLMVTLLFREKTIFIYESCGRKSRIESNLENIMVIDWFSLFFNLGFCVIEKKN